MIQQTRFKLNSRDFGAHLITSELESFIPELENVEKGICNLFLLHTTASLILSESYDQTVPVEFAQFIEQLVPEERHMFEGAEDMPEHIKSALLPNSLTVPVKNEKFELGKRQGIFLFEFRKKMVQREMIATIIS